MYIVYQSSAQDIYSGGWILKPGSECDAKPCVTSMRCFVNTMHRKDKI